MKNIQGLVCILIAATTVAGGLGCKKSGGGASGSTPKTLADGLTQMQAAFGTVSPKAQNLFYNHVQTGYRYSNYPDALDALEQIAADPSLNEQQKKLTADVIALFKAQLGGAAGAPPAK